MENENDYEPKPLAGGTPVEATIVALIATTAGTVFGDKVIVKTAKDGTPLETLEQAKARVMRDIRFEAPGVNGHAVITWPKAYHPKSDLGRFVRRYGRLPAVGVKVFVYMNAETGFFDLDLGK